MLVNFDKNRAIELANLIDKAYEHFDFVKDNKHGKWLPLVIGNFASNSFIDIPANTALRTQNKIHTITIASVPNCIFSCEEDFLVDIHHFHLVF